MKCGFLAGILMAALTSACTSDPYAPVNQMAPIRQMDNAFEGRPINAPPPGYRDQRYSGYDAYGSAPQPRY
jgi:hypothetical protein